MRWRGAGICLRSQCLGICLWGGREGEGYVSGGKIYIATLANRFTELGEDKELGFREVER